MDKKLNDKKKILFLGASITQGKISKSFIKILKEKFDLKQFTFINQGVAGYESYNLLNKLYKAIRTNPDSIILLIGTNDVLSSLDPKLEALSRKLKHIPHKATLLNFSNNITNIIKRLKQETNSKIAIASLPVIGENLDSIENKTVKKYNAELKRIAEDENIIYLSVYEKQRNFLLNEIEGKGKDYIVNTRLAFKSLILHYIFFMKLDTISRRNGFLLQTDGIHQNSQGAKIIADEIEKFIRIE